MRRLFIFILLILSLFAIKIFANEELTAINSDHTKVFSKMTIDSVNDYNNSAIPKSTEEDVRQYAQKNEVSCYKDGVSSCTLMYCGDGYYNEKGEFIPPEPCNTCKYSYRCSDGKVFELEYYTN